MARSGERNAPAVKRADQAEFFDWETSVNAAPALSRMSVGVVLERSQQFEYATRDALRELKMDTTFHRIGSMFCLFFTPGPVVDLASAQRSDLKMFTRFFQGCLQRGIYFAPSQFETGFISTAHSAEDIERTIRAAAKALRSR